MTIKQEYEKAKELKDKQKMCLGAPQNELCIKDCLKCDWFKVNIIKNKSQERIIEMIFEELRRAEKLHPNYPKDLVYASAILSEEAGELLKECFNYEALEQYYGDRTAISRNIKQTEKELMEKILTEGIQTAAMGLRFLFNLIENYEGDINEIV